MQSNRIRDRLSHLRGTGVSANIPRARSLYEHGFNRSYDGVSAVRVAE